MRLIRGKWSAIRDGMLGSTDGGCVAAWAHVLADLRPQTSRTDWLRDYRLPRI